MRIKSGSRLYRCSFAIKYGDNLYTRCLLKPAHSGRHEGRGLKRYVYARVHWFQKDDREFITDKDNEWAWSERRKQ